MLRSRPAPVNNRSAICSRAEGANLATSCGHHAPEAPKPWITWAARGSIVTSGPGVDARAFGARVPAWTTAAVIDISMRHTDANASRRVVRVAVIAGGGARRWDFV